MKNRKLWMAISVASGFASVATVHANLTTINNSWAAGAQEWNLLPTAIGGVQGDGILQYIYGNNVTRVNDSSDIEWIGNPGTADFVAIYAGAGQALYTTPLSGTLPPNGGSPSPILSGLGSTGTTPSRSASSVSFTPGAQPFLFLDEANGNLAYSSPTLSSGSVDRMVTFAVTGYLQTPGDLNSMFIPFATTHYVIAFEDGTDFDFNDLVVEVSGVAPVPEPTTMVAGALLLLPFGMSTLRMLRKNHTV